MATEKQRLGRAGKTDVFHFPSNARKYEEKIVFVHFFGGSVEHLIRHIRLVNSLGFDAIAFNLSYNKKTFLKSKPYSRVSKRFGLEHKWADEIRDVLDFVSGDKIIFSFSNPTASALEAMTLPERSDVKGLICDGGPFVRMPLCTWNLMREQFQIENPILRLGASIGTYFLWSPFHKKYLSESLSHLPASFPILSIRAWKDKLVPVAAIDDAFKNQDHLDLQILEIPIAEHLTGLRDAPEVYKPRLRDFLSSIASHEKP